MLSGATGLSHLLHSRLAARGRSGRCTCGASAKDDKIPEVSKESKQRTELPERGFFAQADTKGALPLIQPLIKPICQAVTACDQSVAPRLGSLLGV